MNNKLIKEILDLEPCTFACDEHQDGYYQAIRDIEEILNKQKTDEINKELKICKCTLENDDNCPVHNQDALDSWITKLNKEF
jgi:hypothetical protein